MIPYSSISDHSGPLPTPERLSIWMKGVLWVLRNTRSGAVSFKLRFYHYLLDYIRVIAIFLVEKNHWMAGFDHTNDKTLEHFSDLLVHLELATKKGARTHLKIGNVNIDENSVHVSLALDQHIDTMPAPMRKMMRHYAYVRDLVGLYRNEAFTPMYLRQASEWKKLLVGGGLDYEVRLAETLFQLTCWEYGHKIPSPFDESYYSESGRNAFENFTRHRFAHVLNNIFRHRGSDLKVLDVGCGYGNYIDALLKWDSRVQVNGLELQEELYREACERFAANEKVKLYCQNILDYHVDEKYDLVLLNYVLFYFSEQDKKQLFMHLKSLLSAHGRILICQYYPRIELMKYKLAKLQNDGGIAQRVEMYYGNKILYANALWNQLASTFSEAEEWGAFEHTLKSCGLQVESITHADRFYYSLFIEVR